jgi:23S rRNA (guanosine2251-2'-O)-methyltransferase
MIFKKLKTEELQRIDIQHYQRQEKADVVVVLDNVRSAQNIGSIFRTSDAFNIKGIYLTGISATPPNKEMLKTALGSTESVSWWYHEDCRHCVANLKTDGYTIVAVEQTLNSVKLHEFRPDSSKKYAFVLGNEVDGVHQDIINASDTTLEIPQFGTKHSLNVSVSAGIVLWDAYQKLFLQQS